MKLIKPIQIRCETPEMIEEVVNHYWNARTTIGLIRNAIRVGVWGHKPWDSDAPIIGFSWVRIHREDKKGWHAVV